MNILFQRRDFFVYLFWYWGVQKIVVKELLYLVYKIFLVFFVYNLVWVVVIIEQLCWFVQVVQGDKKFNILILGYCIIIIIVQDKDGCIDFISIEQWRVFDVMEWFFLKCVINLVLVFFILEYLVQFVVLLDVFVGRSYIYNWCFGFCIGE